MVIKFRNRQCEDPAVRTLKLDSDGRFRFNFIKHRVNKMNVLFQKKKALVIHIY